MAEVLITLGIIGVVAALTIPSLIEKHQKQVVAAKVKKAYTVFSQALKLSEVENGPVEYWDYGTWDSVSNTKRFVNTYIAPYFTTLEQCSQGNEKKCGFSVSGSAVNYFVNDGTAYSIMAYSGAKVMRIMINVNPKKYEDSLIGKDSFYFEFINGKLLPAFWRDGLTREDIIEGYVSGFTNSETLYCKKTMIASKGATYRHACTALLYIDGWEFKKDYPW